MGTDEHLGVAEVAGRLGISRQRLYELRQSYSDFPKPVARISGVDVWHAKDVDRWQAKHKDRGPGRPPTRRRAGGA